MNKVRMMNQDDDSELYILDGTNKAVRIIMGYSTGSHTGLHCALDTFAMAELGTVDEERAFVSDKWTEADFGKGIMSRRMIGVPKVARGWDPQDENGDVNWSAYGVWVEDVCRELLGGELI